MSASPFPEVALSELASIKYGYTESASTEPIGPKFLRITDIQDGSVDWESVPYCAIDVADAKKHQLEDGDIVFARTGATTGKSFLIKEPPNAVPASYLIRLRLGGKKLLPQFLSLFFQTEAYWHSIEKGSSGSAQGGFNASKLGQLKVPIPPLEEQKRIVAVLDQAFAALDRARALAEANLADAEEVFDSFGEALFTEVLATAPEKHALGDLTSPGSGITYGVVKPGGEGSVAFVRGGDLVNGEVRMGQLRTISKEFSEQYRRTLLRGGELLICLVGTPGQCAIAPAALAGANIARQVGMIRLRESLCAQYVRDYLLSKVGQQALGLKTGGSVQQVINLGDLKLIEVPLPDKSRQAEIVEQLTAWKGATDALRQRYQDSIKNIADLRQSLLQKAFAGELT